MALLRCYIIQGAVSVLGVVPTHEGQYPVPGLLDGAEAIDREPWSELQGFEQRFRVGVVVAHPGPAVRGRNAQVVQFFQEGRGFHGAAIDALLKIKCLSVPD